MAATRSQYHSFDFSTGIGKATLVRHGDAAGERPDTLDALWRFDAEPNACVTQAANRRRWTNDLGHRVHCSDYVGSAAGRYPPTRILSSRVEKHRRHHDHTHHAIVTLALVTMYVQNTV